MITCPECGRTSHHPKDREYGWCANCNAFTSPARPTAPEIIERGPDTYFLDAGNRYVRGKVVSR